MRFFVILVLSLSLQSCASREETISYHRAVAEVAGTDSNVRAEMIKAQFAAIQSLKDNPMALMALAMMARDLNVEHHDLSKIDTPDTASKIIGSATPLLGSAALYGLIGFTAHEAFGAAGSTYSAYEQSRINTGTNQDSQNGTGEDDSSSGGGGGADPECFKECIALWPTGTADNGCSCNSACADPPHCNLP